MKNENILNNLTKEDLEQFFKQCNIPYEKAENSRYGFFINDKELQDKDIIRISNLIKYYEF